MMIDNCQCSEPWFDPELGDHLMGCEVAYGAMDLGESNCDKLKRLDREYGTYPWSPLHHDQNCKECKR